MLQVASSHQSALWIIALYVFASARAMYIPDFLDEG
jgi:hypothetical protein